MNSVIKTVLLAFLFAAALEDAKTGTISWRIFAAGALIGITLKLIDGEAVISLLAGTAVGFILLILAFASNEAFGYGDGLLFCMIGVYLGLKNTTLLLLLSLLLGALTAIVLLVAKNRKLKEGICFAPIAFGSYVLYLSLC